MKRIRVLHFTDSLRAGGKERQLVELLKGLSAYKEIVCELAIMSKVIQYNAVNNLDIKKHYLIRKNKKDPRILVKLYKLCKEFKPDIIHTWDSMTSVYAVPVAKMLGIKLINGMIRGAPRLGLFGKEYIRSKITFPFSEVIVGNSNAGLKAYNAPVNKSVCIYNGFDFMRIKNIVDSQIVKNKFNIRTKHVIGMVANFTQEKDYETYITAAAFILLKRDDVTFWAIGEGENMKNYEMLIRKKNEDKVIISGRQQRIESIVNSFSIGVLATVYAEGISNSIMEYMALGRPVVATNSGGTKEIVLDGITGFLVPPGDSKRMAERIEQLLEDSKLSVKMGEEGRKRIRKEFSLEKMTNSYIDLYNRITEEN